MTRDPPLPPDEIHRALFVRIRRFGDTLVLAQAIRAFKAWSPATHLGVVLEPGYEAFLELLPEVDEIIPAEKGPAGALRSLRRVRAFGARLAIDFHGGPRAALLMAASGAEIKIGEARFHWPVYDIRVPHAEQVYGLTHRAHHIENHLALLAGIGIPTPARPLSVPVADEARAALGRRLSRLGVGAGRPAVLFPTTTMRAKQWPIDRWFDLARRLSEAWSGDLILQFAPTEETLAERAAGRVGRARILGGLPLPELNALVSDASLVVAQDSLGAHLAAAHSVPTVVLYGATDPAEYHPWMVEHVILRVDGLVCSPCGGRDCRSPYYRWACIDELDPDVVFETTLAWLRGERPGVRPIATGET